MISAVTAEVDHKILENVDYALDRTMSARFELYLRNLDVRSRDVRETIKELDHALESLRNAREILASAS